MALPSEGSEFDSVRERLAALRPDPGKEEARSAEIDTALQRIRTTLDGVHAKGLSNSSALEQIRAHSVSVTQSPTAPSTEPSTASTDGSSDGDRSAASASS